MIWPVAQTLTERNPASHLIWLVAGIALLALSVIVLVEMADWLRGAFRRRESASEPTEDGAGFHLRPPDTPLRRRFFWKIRPQRRTWSEGRANEPSRHWGSRKSESGSRRR